MKNIFKKVFAAVLATALVFTAVGCGKGSSETEISIFKWDFAQLANAKRQNTPIYSALKEVTGGYDFKAVTSGYGDWETVINNAANTGSLPDVFINYAVDRPQVFSKWIRDGAVLPISDYVSETKYPNIYNRLQEYDWLLDRLGYLDNKFYMLPINIEMTHGMFVRTDWMDNLNQTAKLTTILTEELGRAPTAQELIDKKFKLPENLIEFYRLARAFAKYDPDGNGKPDTYGYSSSNEMMWYNNWIFEAYDSTFFGMVEDGNGGLTSSWITDGNKDAVAFLNKLYAEKIMDPDYIRLTDSNKIDNFCRGRVGIMVDNIYYNNIIQMMMQANSLTAAEAAASVAVIAPPAGENGSYGLRGNPGFWCGTSINAKVSAAKRDAILTLLDYLLSEKGQDMFKYGVEGSHYEVVNGEKVSLMGKDLNGFNQTVLSKDNAFEMICLVDWSFSYNPYFSSNYEYVQELLDRAKTYSRTDPVTYVQTPLYIEKEQILGNDAIEAFVGMIDNKDYAGNAALNLTWSGIKSSGVAYDNAWNSFVNKYKNTWGGAAMIAEYSAEASKYLPK